VPDRFDEMAATARALAADADGVLHAIHTREFSLAHGYVVLMGDALHDLEQRLYAERQARGEAVGEPPNPYRQILLSGPTQEDGLTRLSDAALLEYLRHTHWRYRHEPQPYSRWWLSKHFSAARRELLARGQDPDSWMDGTEGA
jgi:hypothetical protein